MKPEKMKDVFLFFRPFGGRKRDGKRELNINRVNRSLSKKQLNSTASIQQ